jgi:hypothetical protein
MQYMEVASTLHNDFCLSLQLLYQGTGNDNILVQMPPLIPVFANCL